MSFAIVVLEIFVYYLLKAENVECRCLEEYTILTQRCSNGNLNLFLNKLLVSNGLRRVHIITNVCCAYHIPGHSLAIIAKEEEYIF